MGNVHFSGKGRDIPNYALNSPRENVFETNNIRFHIKGKYLSDFSDKGIERFIEKNFNSKSGFLGGIGLGWGGKDLDFKEVKAFIQAAAANADGLKGMTFDLTDPQLGLFDDDDVKVDDIKHSFGMDYKPVQGTSQGEVAFVDATRVEYDIRNARKAESRAENVFKEVQTTHRGLQKELQSAIKERDKIADRIGGNAVEKLAEIDGKLSRFDQQIADLDKDIRDYKLRISQDHIPDSERRQLRLALRGMEMEKTDLVKERKDLQKELTEKHGFWSFLGGGSTLEDLRKANKAVAAVRQRVEAHRPEFEDAQNMLKEATRKREAVERGESWADLNKPAAPATPPTTVAPEEPKTETPPAPTAPQGAEPSVPAPAAGQSATVSGQDHVKKLLETPAAQQVAELAKVPASDRAAVLAYLDQQIAFAKAGPESNLPDEMLKDLAAKAPANSALRLNALLAWGEDAQKAYFEKADKTTQEEILAQINQKLFDQQLATQAEALRVRLSATSVPTEPVQTGAGDEVIQPSAPAADVAVTPPAASPESPPVADSPAGPTGNPGAQIPLTLEAFKKLPIEQQMERYVDLPAADQDLIFSSLTFIDKGGILMQLAKQRLDDEATRERLSQLMRPEEKQALVNQLQAIKQETAGQVYRHTTELNLLLGMFAKQGVTPQGPTPASTETAPQVPLQEPTQPQAPVVEEQAPQVPIPDQPPVTRGVNPNPPQAATKPDPAPTVSQPVTPQEPTLKTVSAEDLKWAQDWAAKVESKQHTPTEAEKQRYNDIQTRVAAELAAGNQETLAATKPNADEIAQELMAMDPNTRMSAFGSLIQEGRKAVFGKLSLPAQTEVLLSMFYNGASKEDRADLICTLSATTKQNLSKAYNEGLAAAKQVDPELAQNMELLIKELGAKVVKPTTAAPVKPVQQQIPPLAPVTGPPAAPPVPSQAAPVQNPSGPLPLQPQGPQAPAGLDMSNELKQLKAILSEKSYFGYGSVVNTQGMHALVEQIWGTGTPGNRSEMAKLLVENKQSQLLAQVLVNAGVDTQETYNVMSGSGFPAEKFMLDIDDNKAYLILENLSKSVLKKDANSTKALALMERTLAAYQKGLDREGPFKQLKNAAQQQNYWTQLPKAFTAKVDSMFSTWWN